MDIEDDDTLLEDDEETPDSPASSSRPIPANMDSRRLIERRRELRQLREQLEDPDFLYDFD